jgi:Tfp pilus assembly protein FimV
MTTETNAINPATLKELEGRVQEAHKTFSAAFHARGDREKELAAIAGQRNTLARELKKVQGALPKVTQTAIDAAIVDPSKVDPTPAFAARSRVRFLKQ